MGLGKGFWDQLRPLARTEELSFLRGKRLAIDLSYWLIQQQTALKDARVRKPHLRLTFYRVVRLVAKVGALPVFVVDGEPPALKQGVRIKRFKRFAETCPSLLSESPTSQESSSSRNGVFLENVEDCVTLLELLGVPVFRARGEAESLCAALNREGLVDACVTPDSDAFVHGAKWVIKTLQLENRNKGAEVELYRAEDIEECMGLRRKHLLALALLVGCDYSPGVAGMGCINAIRLISCFAESEILDRLRAWGRGELPPKNEIDQGVDVGPGVKTVDNASENLSRVTHCSKCGHPGNKKDHANSGCQLCISSSKEEFSTKGDCKEKSNDFLCTCLFCVQRAQKKLRGKSNEWWAKMCQKMASTSGFPDEDIISLFLDSEIETAEDITVYTSSIKWHAPIMEELEIFLQSHLYWEPFYVRQKVLPLLSHFYLTELAAMKSGTSGSSVEKCSFNGVHAPLCIHRIKIEQGEPLYTLKWKSLKLGADGHQWSGLKDKPNISMKQKRRKIGEVERTDIERVEFSESDAEENECCFTTDENMELVMAACPELVDNFDREQVAKQAVRTKAKRKEKFEDNESVKRQSTITSSYKQQKHVAEEPLGAHTWGEKSSTQELSPHTPRRTSTGGRCIDTKSLIAALNSNSTTTTFSLASPASLPRTPRRTISKKVARRLSLECLP